MRSFRPSLALRLGAVTAFIAQLAACGGGGGGGDGSSDPVYRQGWAFPSEAILAQERAQAVVDRLNTVRTSTGLEPVVRSQTYDTLAVANVQAYTAGDGTQRALPMLHQLASSDGTDDRGMTHLQSQSLYAAAWGGNGYGHGWHAVDRMLHEPSLRLSLLSPHIAAVGAGVGGRHVAGNFTRSYGFALIEALAGAPSPQGKAYIYPFNGQQNVPSTGNVTDSGYLDSAFMTLRNGDYGYPVSVHADPTEELNTASFTLTVLSGPQAGESVAGTWADGNHSNTGVQMPSHAAVFYPRRLNPGTTYEARFEGTLNGNPISVTSQFTTLNEQTTPAQNVDRTHLRDGDVATLTGSWDPEAIAIGVSISLDATPGYESSTQPLPIDIEWLDPVTARVTPSGACVRGCAVEVDFAAGYVRFTVN